MQQPPEDAPETWSEAQIRAHFSKAQVSNPKCCRADYQRSGGVNSEDSPGLRVFVAAGVQYSLCASACVCLHIVNNLVVSTIEPLRGAEGARKPGLPARQLRAGCHRL